MNAEVLAHPPPNPPQVIAGFLSPAPVTLGQLALLEKIGSPFVVEKQSPILLDYLPSLYLLTFPAREGLNHLANLEAEALAWADTLTHQAVMEAMQSANAAIQTFFATLPRETENQPPKKA